MALPLLRLDKERLLRVLCDELIGRISAGSARARATAAAAVDDEQRPENEYDTRGLEESYLAAGQAQRVADLEVELGLLRSLKLRAFKATTPISATAVVRLEDEDGEERVIFLLPVAGGLSFEDQGERLSVVSPGSPLGTAVLGRVVDDEIDVVVKGKPRAYTVIDVA